MVSRKVTKRLGIATLTAVVTAGLMLATSRDVQATKPAPAVCGLNSIAECRGALEGSACGGLSAAGYCSGAPNCFCFSGKVNHGRHGGDGR